MGNSESIEYLPLPESPSSSNIGRRGKCYNTRVLRELLLLFVIFVQAAALVIVLAFRPTQDAQSASVCANAGDSALYSPAQNAVEYEGLSEDVDRAWGDLYNRTILKIPKSEAMLLPNKTYPIAEEPGYYIAGLDMFHQLHCLNLVRKALHKEYYTEDIHLTEEHVSHCIDTIRQSLMCSADISVNVWQWSNEFKGVVGYSIQTHTCKNFDKIRDWARERRLNHWTDTRLHIEDGLPDPPVLY